jgi:hypothetical protein
MGHSYNVEGLGMAGRKSRSIAGMIIGYVNSEGIEVSIGLSRIEIIVDSSAVPGTGKSHG